MKLLIDEVGYQVQAEFAQPAPKIRNSRITEKEFEILKKESLTDSQFDPVNLRKQMFIHVFYKKLAPYIVKESQHGKIIALLYSQEQQHDIPWDLWFRILRMFYKGKPFTICFLAHPLPREFPDTKYNEISPFNINGGYTYPCNPSFICIYRAEDATRVLIHELFHASCSDNHDDGLDLVEAKTEAWAELLYCALITRGIHTSFQNQIKKQSIWMSTQNKIISKYYIKKPYDFPWRYTIGKEDIWKQWGIFNKDFKQIDLRNSLRLTYPPTSYQKYQYSVLGRSTIL